MENGKWKNGKNAKNGKMRIKKWKYGKWKMEKKLYT